MSYEAGSSHPSRAEQFERLLEVLGRHHRPADDCRLLVEENHGIDRGLPVVKGNDRHGASRPDKIDGALDQWRRTRALEHEVELATGESITSIVRVNDLDAELGSALAAKRREVVTEHRVDTSRAKDLRDMEPNRAEAKHKRRLSCRRTRAADAVNSDGKRLDRCPVLPRKLLREAEEVDSKSRIGDSKAVGERAGNAETDARLVHVLAEMSEPFATPRAFAARLNRYSGDTRPDDDSFHPASRRDDLTRELVPEHLARLDQ